MGQIELCFLVCLLLSYSDEDLVAKIGNPPRFQRSGSDDSVLQGLPAQQVGRELNSVGFSVRGALSIPLFAEVPAPFFTRVKCGSKSGGVPQC